MVAVELYHWEQKKHNAEKLNTILKFAIMYLLLRSAAGAPTIFPT